MSKKTLRKETRTLFNLDDVSDHLCLFETPSVRIDTRTSYYGQSSVIVFHWIQTIGSVMNGGSIIRHFHFLHLVQFHPTGCLKPLVPQVMLIPHLFVRQ